jgi:hypothetical protein
MGAKTYTANYDLITINLKQVENALKISRCRALIREKIDIKDQSKEVSLFLFIEIFSKMQPTTLQTHRASAIAV